MKIAIVNDTLAAAELLRRTIVGARRHEVAWIARTGEDAIKRCTQDRPDAILLDLVMPGMDGVETTRRIMSATPCAIIVVSGNISDNTPQIFEAMGAGALDAISAPVLNSAGTYLGSRTLLQKLDMISKLVSRDGLNGSDRPSASAGLLVAIGASAGGPAALVSVLGALPENYHAAVVVIQHVDPQFSNGLAQWLDHHSQLPVRLAEQGDRPQAGTVLIAAREEHLIFTSPHRLGYTPIPVETSYRPSVDVFFKSADCHWRGEIVGVLLTGMGRDGAAGLRALRESGHHTIAQNRLSSAVYGMPKAAIDLKAAVEILALDKIGPRLANIFAPKR